MRFPDERTDGQTANMYYNHLSMNRENIITKTLRYYQMHGFTATVRKVYYKEFSNYHRWMISSRPDADTLRKQRNTIFPYAPCISILIPTYNTPLDLLEQTIRSVTEQSYANWQLCIADGSDKEEVRNALRAYAAEDPRICVRFLDRNYGISGNTNQALELAQGEYTGLFDHDDLLEKHALYEIVRALQDARYEVLYTDEDKLIHSNGKFCEPNFKPDYSPEYLHSCNYITHFFVARTSLLKEIGGFRSDYDGSQDYDLILRCLNRASLVRHIPKILYHWRIHDGSTAADPENKLYCYEAGVNAIRDSLASQKKAGSAEMDHTHYGIYRTEITPDPSDTVSAVVVCTEPDPAMTAACIRSIQNTPKLSELILVCDPGHAETVRKKLNPAIPVQVVSDDCSSLERLLCKAADQASGSILFVLNNAMTLRNGCRLATAYGHFADRKIGTVGVRTLYRDYVIRSELVAGDDGFVLDFHKGTHVTEDGYQFRSIVTNNCMAVPFYGMLTRRSLFLAHPLSHRISENNAAYEYGLFTRQEKLRTVFEPSVIFDQCTKPAKEGFEKVSYSTDPYWNVNILRYR